MSMGLMQGLLTLLLMVLFIGIVVWAYSGRQKKRFDEASMLPFAEDEGTQGKRRTGEKNHD
ncbi:CcoQ/FixQ family Cbb3-type cytochrome c oxidase assembly chaperone [Thioalkalivibrio sulfidiphilus]|uniref:Cbb3-type cytochrome oxidase component n=1 Tax=Thioalkalivibrio sulfidiphilus (strain HL-EbGR7) TaxID=396588 RepID=B8GLX4_THISH|nr:CcoQ/FixQ family Cbb3-type cytochrome c oxidase assembly chaperone [Thioalkalivibrio sulfidiphilus]ACL71727.1 Cbb3-type cytochrome oxidase component [Thioalkalivibrio sulfidiphilus HL-EbGr7]